MKLLAGIALFAFSVTAASAASIDFTLTSGTDVITFTLAQQPALVPCSFATSCFGTAPANLIVDGSPVPNGTVNFYTPAELGGLTILDGSTLLVNNGGPNNLELFSGSLTAPILSTYSNLQLVNFDFLSPTFSEGFLISATGGAGTAPEPSAALLLLAGTTLLTALARRKSLSRK